MARNLTSRLDKLEEGSGGNDAAPFYVLWVNPGEDRAAALKSAKAAGKVPAGVASYCAEWKLPDDYVRQGRTLGPRARSRLTDCQRISEDEKSILWDVVGEETEAKLSAVAVPAPKPDERTRQLLTSFTDRELIGALICGCGDKPGIGHDAPN